MSDFGVTEAGFLTKRLVNIKEEVEEELRGTFGEINVDADSVFGQIIGVFSRALAESWEQMENIYNSQYPSSASGINLDKSADLVGVTRLDPTASVSLVQLEGAESTVVPVSTKFSQSSQLKVFESVAAVTIEKAAVHRIKVLVDTAAIQTYTITIDGYVVSFSATSIFSKEDLAYALSIAINIHSIVTELVTAVYTAGDEFLTITINSFNSYVTFSSDVGVNLSLGEIWSPVDTICQDVGALPVPVSSVDTIDTPVSGLSQVTNLTDGVTGREGESDSAFRIRREVSLDVISAATIGSIRSRLVQDLDSVTAAFAFENRTDIVDAGGKPPHSFEVVVAALDNVAVNLEIADKIWEVKPAGIETFGTTSVVVKDFNGDNQLVRFSHATNIYIHIELTYSTTGADQEFPLNGEDSISEEILRLANLLSFGSDLLIQVFEGAGYIPGGVTNVIVRQALTANPGDSPSWQTANIAVDIKNIPVADVTRITIIDGS